MENKNVDGEQVIGVLKHEGKGESMVESKVEVSTAVSSADSQGKSFHCAYM